jgi:hypothetical protein
VGSELEGESVLGVAVLGAGVLHCTSLATMRRLTGSCDVKLGNNRIETKGAAYDGEAVDGVGVVGARVGLDNGAQLNTRICHTHAHSCESHFFFDKHI